MFNIVLHTPKIPPNTGNIIRLCANTGFGLHLIEPLGFSLDAKQLRRAGLDYHETAQVKIWQDWPSFQAAGVGRLISFSTRSLNLYHDVRYEPGDCLVFGSETEGLPQQVFDDVASELQVTLPMRQDSRSLNLSNSVAIVAFEAWRQRGFRGAAIQE